MRNALRTIPRRNHSRTVVRNLRNKLQILIILTIFTNCNQKMTEIDKVLNLSNNADKIIAIGELIDNKIGNSNSLENLSDSEKTFLYVDILEREVNNGGFSQFFYNSSGQYAHEIHDAYQKIGANKAADIINRAIKLFPTLPVPKNWETRQDIVLEIDSDAKLWNELDNEFYKYEDNISDLMIKFVEQNKADFE